MKFLPFIIILLLSGCDKNTSPVQSGDLPSKPDSNSTPRDSTVLQSTEVLMGCMDLVTSGGILQAVIRSQSQYDSIIYARFRKPLDDWWNANYPTVLSYVKQQYPNLSDAQCDSIAIIRMYTFAPVRGTDTCTQPTIDFSRYTLLYIAS
jgi:hypothetical protein